MTDFRKTVKKFIPLRLFRKIEPIGHMVEAVIANVMYGFPARGMHIIGVTGTNGKTTTTFLIEKMLHEAGLPVAMLSTVAYGIGDNIKPQMIHMTTDKSSVLQRRIRDFRRAGVQWVVLESSSHSLAQNRVWGIPYEIGVMTNVTDDHLDYHGSFKSYLQAKSKLFKIVAKHGRKFGVVNADDPNSKKFTDLVNRHVTYGINSGQLKATDIHSGPDHSTFKVNVDNETYNIRINIPGDFNISNALAAVAVGRELGLSRSQIEQGISSLSGVEGRMTVIDEGQKFKVIIDFASTPDAFERLFRSIRPLVKGKLVPVFGSAGRRDEAKRSVQGEIAGKFSDEVVLTEEDDRDVDGNQILQQIAEGARKSGKVIDKNMFLVHDRTKAIEFAVSRVKSPDDMVILLGKGHEKTIERADGEHPWSEIETARKTLRELVNKSR